MLWRRGFRGGARKLVDHLEHTRGFSLSALKYLVLDEADRMLGLDFEEEVRWIFFSLRL
jgi:ATP-dependent RNA helicase DDX47/RRP3